MAMAPSEPAADPDRPVHIVFVGAGAVGCFYASRLHHPRHNVHVSLIARSNYGVLAGDGVAMQTRSFGDYTFRPHAVFPSVAAAAAAAPDLPAGGWDFVVVTTKALPDRGDDSATVAPLALAPACRAVVLIQNGVGVEAPYRARFPRCAIVSAVTVVSAEQTAPGTVRQNRWTRLHLGPYTDSAQWSESESPSSSVDPPSATAAATTNEDLRARGAAATALLAGWCARLGGLADVEALDETGLQTVRWHKLCINAAFNPSAVLAGGRGNADMAADPDLRLHLRGVMDELWAAAPRVLGRPFPAHLAGPDRILRSSERNRGAKPSMLLDWEARRPLELEVILGNPVRIARARGVDLPRLQTLYALLKSAQRAREEGDKARGKL